MAFFGYDNGSVKERSVAEIRGTYHDIACTLFLWRWVYMGEFLQTLPFRVIKAKTLSIGFLIISILNVDLSELL